MNFLSEAAVHLSILTHSYNSKIVPSLYRWRQLETIQQGRQYLIKSYYWVLVNHESKSWVLSWFHRCFWAKQKYWQDFSRDFHEKRKGKATLLRSPKSLMFREVKVFGQHWVYLMWSKSLSTYHLLTATNLWQFFWYFTLTFWPCTRRHTFCPCRMRSQASSSRHRFAGVRYSHACYADLSWIQWIQPSHIACK